MRFLLIPFPAHVEISVATNTASLSGMSPSSYSTCEVDEPIHIRIPDGTFKALYNFA